MGCCGIALLMVVSFNRAAYLSALHAAAEVTCLSFRRIAGTRKVAGNPFTNRLTKFNILSHLGEGQSDLGEGHREKGGVKKSEKSVQQEHLLKLLFETHRRTLIIFLIVILQIYLLSLLSLSIFSSFIPPPLFPTLFVFLYFCILFPFFLYWLATQCIHVVLTRYSAGKN